MLPERPLSRIQCPRCGALIGDAGCPACGWQRNADWRSEVQALRERGRHQEAGELALHHVQNDEEATAGADADALANDYALAMACFAAADTPLAAEQFSLCRDKVRFYWRLPNLRVELPAAEVYSLDQAHPLPVRVTNTGLDTAYGIRIELAAQPGPLRGRLADECAQLASGSQWQPNLEITPAREGKVRLECTVTYADLRGSPMEDSSTWEIEGKALSLTSQQQLHHTSESDQSLKDGVAVSDTEKLKLFGLAVPLFVILLALSNLVKNFDVMAGQIANILAIITTLGGILAFAFVARKRQEITDSKQFRWWLIGLWAVAIGLIGFWVFQSFKPILAIPTPTPTATATTTATPTPDIIQTPPVTVTGGLDGSIEQPPGIIYLRGKGYPNDTIVVRRGNDILDEAKVVNDGSWIATFNLEEVGIYTLAVEAIQPDNATRGNLLIELRVVTPEVAIAPTDIPTTIPTDTPTDIPTDTPTDEPTDTPTVTPTVVRTVAPTDTPTAEPLATPTVASTIAPTASAAVASAVEPAVAPADKPPVMPTDTPTAQLTVPVTPSGDGYVTLLKPPPDTNSAEITIFEWEPHNISLLPGQEFEVVVFQTGVNPLGNSSGPCKTTLINSLPCSDAEIQAVIKNTNLKYSWTVLLVQKEPYTQLRDLASGGWPFELTKPNAAQTDPGTGN